MVKSVGGYTVFESTLWYGEYLGRCACDDVINIAHSYQQKWDTSRVHPLELIIN